MTWRTRLWDVDTIHVYVRATHPNYKDAVCGYDLMVTEAPASDQNLVCPTAASSTWVYDAQDHSVVATVSPIGTGDSPTIEYSLDSLSWSTTEPKIKDVDTIHVYVRATHPNYKDAVCGYDLMVTEAPASDQNLVCPTAASSTWVYDAQDHSVVATVSPIGTGYF